MSKKKHRGSDFRDFLNEQGLLGEVEARALKQALSLQLDLLLKANELTKTQMAARMKTSRAAVDRLLDASNSSVMLNTLGSCPCAWSQIENRIGAGLIQPFPGPTSLAVAV